MKAHGTVLFGRTEIQFKLLFVNRKTMEIAVHPDQTVVVKAPSGTPYKKVENKVLKRAAWIVRQLNFFQQFEPRTPKRNYVGGETHFYLGKRYRLKIHDAVHNGVKLNRGFFNISVKSDRSPEHIKKLMDAWYVNQAEVKFRESIERCWIKFAHQGVVKPRLSIRRMKKRWGSLSKKGLLTLNTNLIRAPKACIDYVITHELCHTLHHDHGSDFYRLLERVMPDWEKRKAKLELAMV
ncbi:M48 family metallopeptidase [Desulfosarcina ovata]|uniref:Metal-dependent hydrolase n=1 Tax=Desulfosarcina ovata subsp. ovata TaxID=2752305 RepID=A0A5K8AFS5_9BACT|nr:SprT family zinc-dependent metalloprotease [Desulfosarcina ovata]BBO90754.1 metal-dependent hydrolase [Desulfosarcina ovata subsp. ovata]